jgi:hypothetical protein
MAGRLHLLVIPVRSSTTSLRLKSAFTCHISDPDIIFSRTFIPLIASPFNPWIRRLYTFFFGFFFKPAIKKKKKKKKKKKIPILSVKFETLKYVYIGQTYTCYLQSIIFLQLHDLNLPIVSNFCKSAFL